MGFRSRLRPFIAIALFCASVSQAQDSGFVTIRPDPDGVATTVSIGIFILDVVEINDVAQTFTSDVLATISWTDPRLALSEDAERLSDRMYPLSAVWNPGLTLINRRDVQVLSPDIVRVTASGDVTFEARRFATFASPFDLEDFPFDSQTLRMDFASTQYGRDEIEITLNQGASGQLSTFSVAGWVIEPGDMVVSEVALHAGEPVARVVQNLHATRQSGFFVTKVIVPLSLIVFMAATVFWVDPENTGPQLGISTASVLTLIAFQFSLVRMLPPVSYLTRIDLFLLGSMFLVFLALGEAIYTSRITKEGRHDDARRVDVYARVIYTVLFALIVLFTLVV